MLRSAALRRMSFNVVMLGAGLSGLALVAWGMTLPVYNDIEAARRIKAEACIGGHPKEGWYEPLVALQTWRHPLMQSGFSLLLAILVLFVLHRLFVRRESGAWQTPADRYRFFVLGYFVLASGWAATIYSLYLDTRRGDVPWCADSIVIPVSNLTLFYGILAVVCTLVGGALALAFDALPASLWQWNSKKKIMSLVLSAALAGLALLVALLTCFQAVGSGFLGTTAGVVAVYLILATRAALLAPRVDKTFKKP